MFRHPSTARAQASGADPRLPADAPIDSVDPTEVLEWAARAFPGRTALSTSLGPQSLVILNMLTQLGRPIRAFFLDTGVLFAETYALRRRIEDRYGVPIRTVRPRTSLAEQAEAHGPSLWRRNPDHCCHIRKVAPLADTLRGLDAWITGIRRDQSPSRSGTQAIEWDEQFGLVKINPLVGWSRADVDRYVSENDIPTNPLLELGYRSVGCRPCTSLPSPDSDPADERAGRWAGATKTECGIHPRLTVLDQENQR